MHRKIGHLRLYKGKIYRFEEGGYVDHDEPRDIENMLPPNLRESIPVRNTKSNDDEDVPLTKYNESGEKVEKVEKEYKFRTPLPAFNRVMDKYKGKKIKKIEVFRKPILGLIDKAINVILAGGFEKIKKKLGYDSFFHLGLKLEMEGGDDLILERNQNLKLKPWEGGKDVETRLVGKYKGDKTIDELVGRTIEKYGEDEYEYDPFENNCQMWTSAVLKANGLLTRELSGFINQDMSGLIKEYGTVNKSVLKRITGSAAVLDRFIQTITGGRVALKDGGIL